MSMALRDLKSSRFFKIVIGVSILLFIGLGAWYFYESQDFLPKPVKTTNWLTFHDNYIGYTISYPPEMLPPHQNCERFILPADEKERENVLKQRKSGTDIGLILKGLSLGICTIANPDKLPLAKFVPQYTKRGGFRPTTIGKGNYQAFASVEIEGAAGKYFFESPSGSIVSMWWRDGTSETNPRFMAYVVPMLNSFEFTGSAASSVTWQTYANETDGYSFEYPPNWQIDERTKDSGNFRGTPYTFVYERSVEFAPGISIYTIPLTTPKEWLGDRLNYEWVTQTPTTIGGLNATRVDGVPGALLQKYYFINHDGKTVIIFTDTDSKKMEDIASQVVSTFVFLE